MAKGFKHGTGGGTSLNLKVVGNPQPASPKENTIWVNTDKDIAGWIFSAEEPPIKVEGAVWFPTGTSSTAPFNVLKRNGIMVYPLSAKQCVNGAWVERVAKSYQNGAWVDWWNGELYDNGNEYDFITGSWIPYKTSFPDLTAVEPKVTRNPSSIKIRISQDGGYGGTLVTKNKVSFKGKKSLVFTGSSSGEGNSRCCIRIWSQMATNFDTYKVAEYSFPSGGISDSTVRLDVNSLDGEYYVGLCIVSIHWIEMKSMKLE